MLAPSLRPRARSLALLGIVGLAIAACDTSSVPATPPITPGTSGTPRQVNVILKDYLFVPGIVDLVPGETITLNVVNGGLDVHELVLGPIEVQQALGGRRGRRGEPAARSDPGGRRCRPASKGLRVVVASGATQTITYTVPTDIGEQLLLGCHISDHWERGMAGAVRLVGPGGVPLATPAPVSP